MTPDTIYDAPVRRSDQGTLALLGGLLQDPERLLWHAIIHHFHPPARTISGFLARGHGHLFDFPHIRYKGPPGLTATVLCLRSSTALRSNIWQTPEAERRRRGTAPQVALYAVRRNIRLSVGPNLHSHL